MRKATRITYDPFENTIGFKIAQQVEGPFTDLSEGSSLLKYANQSVLFSNCVVDIVSIINESHNSVSDGLEIQFEGPTSDFPLLERTAKRIFDERGGAGPLTCKQVGAFRDANSTLDFVRESYGRISSEFRDYLPGGILYENGGKEIGDNIVKFEETISDAIPVCVIGNYSVGKSALINSLIGEDVLPSKVDPSTSKNVKVIRSDRYAMTFTFADGNSAPTMREYLVFATGLEASGEDPADHAVASRLNSLIGTDSNNEVGVIRSVLEALNEGEKHPEEPEFLASFGCNVIIELPFKKSLLAAADNKIVFFDTPGNDNTNINQEEHSVALHSLLGEQTNALPILVTERDRTSGKGTGDVMHMLDEYAENFSSPSCLIVLTKCDKLSKSELSEDVSSEIGNWHGKSIILFTTPIGALGERKGPGSRWHDESYKDFYEDWQHKQEGPKRVSLPEYNIYPCGRRGTLEETGAEKSLFDTGIPSLEYEILHYIEHHSKYKKCVRGRRDLLDALEAVKRELDIQKKEEACAKRLAERKKAEKRAALVSELDTLQITMTLGLDKKLEGQFEVKLDDYCRELTVTMRKIYDELDPDSPLAMDELLNTRIREHCQENLVDAVYLGDDGAKQLIVREMTELAERYAESLQSYVSKNESHFTEYGRRQLVECLGRDLKPPIFREVSSILEGLGELFEKAVLIQHGVLRLANKPKAARDSWVDSKARSFEAKLRGKKDLLGRDVPGVFLTTVFTKPIERYFNQVCEWGESYKSYIKEQLDCDNTLLSDMELKIERLGSKIADLERRLDEISDVQKELEDILDPIETRP